MLELFIGLLNGAITIEIVYLKQELSLYSFFLYFDEELRGFLIFKRHEREEIYSFLAYFISQLDDHIFYAVIVFW